MSWRRVQTIFIPLLFVLANQAQAAIPQTERATLLVLYTVTGGDNWHDNAHWQAAEGTECSWYGVSCDAAQTTVTGLALSANNLKGSLPAELTHLINLTSSDFRYNAVYSDNTGLINFLDATGPVGSLLDTQTLDADNIVFSNVGNAGFDITWNPVAYMQDGGGYRVYMAEQIDSDTGSVVTDFVQIAEVADKANSSVTLGDLVPCRQYFVKVVSYTNVHLENNNEVESDGVHGPIMGTIPGFNSECRLVGSPYHDVFNITSGGDSVVNISVSIAVANTGNRVYDIIYPGSDIVVGSIDGAAGSDDIYISATGSITILSDSSLSGATIMFDAVEIIVSSDWAISNGLSLSISSGELIIVDPIFADFLLDNLEPVSVPEGSALVYGEGSIAITSGVGTYDLAEDTAVNHTVTTINVKFLLRDEFADQMVYQLSAGNDDDVFSIDSKTGEITLVKPLDFEAVAQYQLEVSASDGGANYVGKIIVNITDVADDDAAAGCSLRRGAAFDPVWLFMLALAGVYGTSRVKIS